MKALMVLIPRCKRQLQNISVAYDSKMIIDLDYRVQCVVQAVGCERIKLFQKHMKDGATKHYLVPVLQYYLWKVDKKVASSLALLSCIYV